MRSFNGLLTLYTKGVFLAGLVTILRPTGSVAQDKDNLLSIATTGTPQEQLQAYFKLNEAYSFDRLDSALWASLQALEIAKQLNDLAQLATAYRVLGTSYGDVGLYDLAIENTYTSIKLTDSLSAEDANQRIADCYHNLAWYYTEMEDFDKPLKLFHQALRDYPLETAMDSAEYSVSYHAIGSYHYVYEENYDSAIFYLRKAFDWRDIDAVGTAEKIDVLVELANAYYFNDEIAQGDSVINVISESPQNELSLYLQNYVLYLKGVKYHQLGEFEKAIVPLEQVYAWGDSTEFLNSSTGINLIRQLIESLKGARQYEKAFAHLETLREIEQNTIYKDRQRTTKALEFQYETARKERQIDAQTAELIFQKRILWTVAVAMTIVLILFGLLYRTYRQIDRKNQKIQTLMRELHHRVKNNLQVISSLLGLQSMRLDDKAAQKAVEEGRERIRAMSLIHQKLYQDENVTAVNIKDYIENLVDELAQSYGVSDKANISVQVPNIPMEADRALPVGLIINELVSNTFKYAYADIEDPRLEVSLLQSEGKDFNLRIHDNGNGLPNDLSVEKANSFGLKLVKLLIKQLNAKLKVDQKNGLTYSIAFT